MLERADCIDRKTLDNNDLNQVVASSGFSENKDLGRVWVGCSASRAHKTLSGSFLLKDFRIDGGKLLSICYTV